MEYRLTTRQTMYALYHCTYCHKIGASQITLKRRGSVSSGWTTAGTENRKDAKLLQLTHQLEQDSATLEYAKGPLSYLGKTIDGDCPYCHTRQPWMRMSYFLWCMWIMIVGTAALVCDRAGWRPFCIGVLVLSVVGMIIHAAVMLTRTKAAMRRGPILIAATPAQLIKKADVIGGARYMAELQKRMPADVEKYLASKGETMHRAASSTWYCSKCGSPNHVTQQRCAGCNAFKPAS